MNPVKIISIGMAILFTPFLAFGDFQFFQKEHSRQRLMAGGPPVIIKNGVYSQAVDHFSGSPRTFPQRYWFSDTMAKGSSSPVLLFICGESQCGGGTLYGPISSHARDSKAYLFALEHRYYGKSQPFADLSASHLQYLKTEQVLADLRDFKQAMQKQYGLQGPWILVGGSYAGNLAAYARIKYPEDFRGALSSSAPVKVKLTFTEFDAQLAEAAGKECSQTVQELFNQVESKIQDEAGLQAMKSLFSAPTIKIKRDFLELLSDITAASLVYGYKDEYCNALKQQGLSGLVAMKRKIDKDVGDFSKYASSEAEDISIAKNSGSIAMRQWYYQQCTEYGYWQNANSQGLSVRSPYLNMSAQDELCQRLFGLSGAGAVEITQQNYFQPLLASKQAQIFMTNGSLDPWRHLSITDNAAISGTGIELMMMPGALHCDDLSTGGNADVVRAKARFKELLLSWKNN